MIVLILIFFMCFVGFIAFGTIITNKGKLKEMDRMIAEFEAKKFSTTEERESAKQELKKKLIVVKNGIQADKRSTDFANDKISIL